MDVMTTLVHTYRESKMAISFLSLIGGRVFTWLGHWPLRLKSSLWIWMTKKLMVLHLGDALCRWIYFFPVMGSALFFLQFLVIWIYSFGMRERQFKVAVRPELYQLSNFFAGNKEMMLNTKRSKFWVLFSAIWHRKGKYRQKNHWLNKIFTVFTICIYVLYCD